MFIPKNINKRVEDFKRMQAKELKEYEEFVKEFSKNLNLLKGKKSIDEKEQLFIDLIQDCVIKLDQQKYPFIIFMFKDDDFMLEYHWKNAFLWCSYDKVWKVFESKFNMSYDTWRRFIADQIETYFKFRPSITSINSFYSIPEIEAYFKSK